MVFRMMKTMKEKDEAPSMNAREAAEASRKLAEHPATKWTQTRVDDRRMDKHCTRCGATESKDLPVGPGDGPEKVPLGFDEELHAWVVTFLDRHVSCTLQDALRDHDTRVLFDGRTLVVACRFYTVVHHTIVAERTRIACSGPKFRLTVGGLSRDSDGAFVTKTFINTDETYEEVAARVRAMNPAPSRATVGIADTREAAALWAELHRVQDGGD